MRLALVLVLIAIAGAPAHAAPAAEPEPATAEATHTLALAANTPVTWHWSLAASAWLGLDRHNAIRGNFARYRGPVPQILLNTFYGDGDDDSEPGDLPPDFGITTDLGVAWAYYPRRVLDGPMVEAGLLARFNHLRDRIDSRNVASEHRFTREYGARVLVGWSWRLSDWWFITTGVGGVLAYEHGEEQTFAGYTVQNGMTMETFHSGRVSRPDVSLEGYLRVGLAFSL